MTDQGRYSHLSSKELHTLFGYKNTAEDLSSDSVEVFNTTLLLYEQLSLELLARYQSAADHITAYYTALEREAFAGFSDTQIGLIKQTYKKIEKFLNRLEIIKRQLLDFSFLERVPDSGLQQLLAQFIDGGAIDGDMIAELFDGLESDNPVERLEAAEQVIFSATRLQVLDTSGAGQIARPGTYMIPSVPGVTFVGYSPEEIDPSLPLSKQSPSHILRLALHPRHLNLMREVPLTESLARRMNVTQGADLSQTLELPKLQEGYTYLPLAVESHYTIRTAYGSTIEERNALLQYQDAIKRGLLSGAVIELRGKIDADFLTWIMGEKAGEPGPIPDVEIAYSLSLPSGKAEYRFPIKLPHDIHTSTAYPSPNIFSDPRDKAVANTIRKLLIARDKKHFIDFLCSEPSLGASEALQPYIGNPSAIPSVDLYQEYEDFFWDRLNGIVESLHISSQREHETWRYDELIRSTGTEEELRPVVRQIILNTPRGSRLFQDANEKDQEQVITLVIKRIMQIRRTEYPDNRDQDVDNRHADLRGLLGYSPYLPPNGFPLSLHYIITDTILPYFKKGQTSELKSEYTDPRLEFEGIEGLHKFLINPNLDCSYREIELHDPQEDLKKQKRLEISVNDRKGAKIYRETLVQNLKRAELFLKKIRQEAQVLDGIDTRTLEQEEKHLSLHAILSRVARRSAQINSIKERLMLSQEEKERALRSMTDKDKRRFLEERIDAIVDRGRYVLQTIYQECIQSEKLWSDFAIRISKDKKTNNLRLSYVILKDGTFLCNLSKKLGSVKNTNHSDLAGGENVYAAGELVFEKVGPGRWRGQEINNGSGHYLPDGRCLYYVVTLLERAGFDMSHARKVDSILRIDLETGYQLRSDQMSGARDFNAEFAAFLESLHLDVNRDPRED